MKKVNYYKFFYCINIRKNEYLKQKNPKRNHQVQPNNTVKAITKECKSKQKVNIENYLTKKNIKKRT